MWTGGLDVVAGTVSVAHSKALSAASTGTTVRSAGRLNFQVASAEPIANAASSIQVGNLEFSVIYRDNMVIVGESITSFLPGDYNHNSVVAQEDLDLVLSHWGDELLDPAAAGWLSDPPVGTVDQLELDRVLAHWGSVGTDTLSAANVPEPTTVTFFFVALAISSMRRMTALAA